MKESQGESTVEWEGRIPARNLQLAFLTSMNPLVGQAMTMTMCRNDLEITLLQFIEDLVNHEASLSFQLCYGNSH